LRFCLFPFTSDSFSLIATKAVQTWTYFGQLYFGCHTSCPNLGLLRTAFLRLLLKLSELRLTSDSFSTIAAKAVRTWTPFGQLYFGCHSSCPNLGLLRTAFLRLLLKLSEPRITSDSFTSVATQAVRTWTPFGQHFFIFHQSCPNSGLLRTAFLRFPPKLSELWLPSDSFSSISAKAVRTQAYFGQLFIVCHESCPNLGLLRTAFLRLLLKLSELGPTSDSISTIATKVVRTWIYFGQLFTDCHESCPNPGILRTAVQVYTVAKSTKTAK
jgi:hypothetical protein